MCGWLAGWGVSPLNYKLVAKLSMKELSLSKFSYF